MPVRLVSQEEPLPGYRLIERLGRGGFGEVWKVEAPGGLLKAMKFVFGDLDAGDEDSRPAEQELKALKRVQSIRHPYVLSLERYDILEGQLIITMELADENLWDRFRKCRSQGLPGVPRDELLRYMEEAAEAIDLMNNFYQIQHLDIKPQNLFVVFNHVKVGDFGLAKLLEGVRATVTGGVTPVYAAPETFEGYVSRYSDQYSLAIVFQELLSGTRPFNGANTRQLLMQHLNGTPDLNPLPLADQPIIGRGLSKKPDDRWPTCTEMVRALKLSGLAHPPTTPPSANTLTSRRQSPATPNTVTDDTPGESSLATRVQLGGSGRLGTDPLKGSSSNGSGGTSGSGSGLVITPMPPLVTVGPNGNLAPRLVTPSSGTVGLTPAVTLQRPQIFQTGRMNSLGIAPPERIGDGVLFPALIIAVGHLGRVVVEHLRRVARDRYGSIEKLPHLRFLYVDTDPDVGALQAGPQEIPGGFAPREVVVARLNRSVHYLQRDTLPPVDQWLPPGILYKLPRSPGAAGGVRAFGRLALFDNYRLIAQRVRQDVETFLTDDPLTKAEQATKLGLRTNRPRAYVVAGLGGGTGGGMFIDLAYLIRQELRSVGYIRPEVVGMFLVPPADKTAPRNAALGNTHAALTELYHFQARRTKYQTTFDKSEAPVVDGDAPFARVAVLQLPKAVDPKGRAELAVRAARAMFNEILTPAGRVADEVRDVYRNAFPSLTPTCQTFGLFRLTWPRPEVLAAATRRFAQRLIQRWTAKDATTLRDPIGAWLDRQWADRKLGFDQVIEGFNAAARAALREDPEKVFDAFVDPLRTRTPSGSKLDAAAACSVLEQLIKVVGKPPCEDDQTKGSLNEILATRFQELTKEAEGQLAYMAVTFIEQPQYRLAGSEEAVRQIGERLKRQIDVLEPVLQDMDKEVKTTFGKLIQTIGGLGSWRGGTPTAEVLDLLRAYPRARLRLQVLDLCLSAYRKLLGATPEYLREIGMCRAGLADMHSALAAVAGADISTGPGKLILPEGCLTLDDAADRFLAGVNPEDILVFDQSVQKETHKKFRGLAAVCLKPAEKGPQFREMLLTRTREFLDAKLDAADPATVFFRNRTGGPIDHPLIAEAYEEAGPNFTGLLGGKPDEVNILAVPPGSDGDRFRVVVAEALPGIEFTPAPLPDDIAFYREYPRLDMAALPHLGDAGRDAAQVLAASDHPPHARVDITWSPPVEM
jgi:serine/threonine protein kinase